MTPNTKKHIGLILLSLAAIGQEFTGFIAGAVEPANNDTPTDAGAGGDAPRGRGRPKKEDSTAAAGTPAGGAAAPTGGKTYEELRGLIEGPIKDGKGPDVKALIEKHGGAGKKLQDLANMPEVHAAFIKDLDALSY